MQNSVGQYQSKSDPAQSGVHIQIYNPSVGTPGAAPVYNVNAPSYGTNPFAYVDCYPSNYYTNHWGQPCVTPQYNTYTTGQPTGNGQTGGQAPYQNLPNQQPVSGQAPYQNFPNQQPVSGQAPYQNFPNQQPVSGQAPYQNFPNQQPVSGQAPYQNFPNQQPVSGQAPYQNLPNQQPVSGQVPYQNLPNQQPVSGQATYQNLPNQQPVSGQVPYQNFPNQQPVSGQVPYPAGATQEQAAQQNTYNQQGQTVNGTQVNGNQTITINNPTPNGQANDTSNNSTNTTTSASDNSDKKTEKRNIVMLTDEYIKNVENYLNSQDKEVRLMGAKEVVARALEDPSRKDDKALNALVNKMIQDPDMKVRFLGLSLLYSRTITGDDYTVGVLKNLQNSTSGYGQDALMAANILLKMSGQTTEKEFEVTDKDKKKKKTEDINKVMTLL